MISEAVQTFLADNGWGKAQVHFLAGDASPRQYYRVRKTDQAAVLMIDPPPHSVQSFISVAKILQTYQLSAPQIYAQDLKNGYLLLEDLGDLTYTKALSTYDEETLYTRAVDVLVSLYEQGQQRQNISGDLPAYSLEFYEKELLVFADWYLPYVCGMTLTNAAKKNFLSLWKEALQPVLKPQYQTLVLRDYHIDNLVWLPARSSVQRVGLLDFQDACWGHLAYDLVSFLEDARRDISPTLQMNMQQRFFEKLTTVDQKNFLRDYAILGAQRSTKILGVFTRLAVKTGKPHYMAHLPRVWRWLGQDMKHPVLSALKLWYDQHVTQLERQRTKVVSSDD